MTPNEIDAQLSEVGPRLGNKAKPDYVIEWKKIATFFNHTLLVASLVCSGVDAAGRTRKTTRVLGKVIKECVKDPFSRFVFWLSADLNIENARLDAETHYTIRRDLAKTVAPPTELEVKEMNVRMNSLPDYLRVFYLEDYFDVLTKNKKKGR
jgi:hypothetical protein